MNQLQRNLLYLIQKQGINPTILAKEAGVQQPTLHRILSGESEDPRTATLQPLADYFNCTVEYLRTADIEVTDIGREQFFKDVESGKINAADEAARAEAGQLAAQEERRVYVTSTIQRQGRAAAVARREGTALLMNSLQTLAPTIKNEVPVTFNSYSARADLLGEKVCAEIKAIPSADYLSLFSPAKVIEGGIFHLTTLRNILKQTGHGCEHFVLIISPASALDPSRMGTALQLAAVHGILVALVERPLEAAPLLAELEAGRGLSLISFDEELPG